ncbi:thioesterase family protein [bacterium]|nr:thioesterase family protein [bacterium]MBU1073100.1 thioesterase family protein [bacterium]MBU1674412.1 thioesterase family protein [bacterium]
MPRLSLTPLASYGYTTEITVRTTDLNYGGHLGNDRLLALLHEARVGFLAAHGWSELDCGGVPLIMGDAALVFRGEAFAGDVLRIAVGVSETGRAGFRLSYLVTRPADGADVAVAETGLAGFDYAKRGIAPLPDDLRSALEDLRHEAR